MNKKMMTIASILFALMFIGVISLLLNQVNEYGNNTSNSIANLNSSTVMSELEPYNGKVVSGDTIVNLINTKARLSDGSLMTIAVGVNTSSSASYVYGLKRASSSNNYVGINQRVDDGGITRYCIGVSNIDTSKQIYYDTSLTTSDAKYIPPFKEYKGCLMYDWGGSVVVGIYFKPV